MMMDVRLLSIGSSQSTPAYAPAGSTVPQFPVPVESSLTPSLPVCVCRSCPVSLAVWLPCWATTVPAVRIRTTYLYSP